MTAVRATVLTVGLAAACLARGAAAAPDRPSTPADVAFFERQVRPILQARCVRCHGDAKAKGGLRLTSRAAVLKGGDLGPAVSLTRPAESRLLQAVNRQGLEMPPGGRLPQREIDVLTRWVAAGVPWTPGAAEPATAEPPAGRVTPEARHYWAYRPVQRPAVPPVRDHAGFRNPIDAFIQVKLEAQGLTPAAPADRVTLIRRATYDLIGLPPRPEDVDAFMADPAPDAYERLIDRLLASPQYGEKWGRHWLDLVRFAETHGYERDSPKPFAWRYRDYVIASFNRDKPYDVFLREQLAGDELDRVTPETLIATGYYRLGLWDDEPADPPLARYDVLDGIVSTTGQVVLGTTVNCARCHDHKRDPIPQRDYYRLLACFRDVTPMNVKNTRTIAAGPGTMEVMCVEERGREETHVLIRGNPGAPGELVEAGFPEVLCDRPTRIALRLPTAPTSGKRRALAEWLTSPTNPLTARVLVNRLWQHHFGRGIVPTPNDFGRLGEPPTLPELLDWLADEFVRGGWRIKRMHRLLMTSAAYRMAATADARGLREDPANLLFGRFNMRRLTAEEVRDSMLAVSGRLNPKAGGPGVYPTLPAEVLHGQSMPGSGWGKSPPHEAARRSVYVHLKRSLLVPILATHDLADTDSSCPVRYTTTVPTQALGMLNGAFTHEQAAALADRLRREFPGDRAAQVRRAIHLTTARTPADEEVRRDVAFIQAMQTEEHRSPDEALRLYCLMMLNTNEFLYLD